MNAPLERRRSINSAIAEAVAVNLARADGADVVVLARRPGAPATSRAVLLVHRSTREPGRWQLSWLGPDGSGRVVPMGHATLPTRRDTVASASGAVVGGEPPHGDRDYVVARVLYARVGRPVARDFEDLEVPIP